MYWTAYLQFYGGIPFPLYFVIIIIIIIIIIIKIIIILTPSSFKLKYVIFQNFMPLPNYENVLFQNGVKIEDIISFVAQMWDSWQRPRLYWIFHSANNNILTEYEIYYKLLPRYNVIRHVLLKH